MAVSRHLRIRFVFRNGLKTWFPYHRKRHSSIVDPLLGDVPVAYVEMETRLNSD